LSSVLVGLMLLRYETRRYLALLRLDPPLPLSPGHGQVSLAHGLAIDPHAEMNIFSHDLL
jgi:hypothetical protein